MTYPKATVRQRLTAACGSFRTYRQAALVAHELRCHRCALRYAGR